MRLTLHTDYAIRVLLHAGRSGGKLVTIHDIAESHGISKNHLTKVVHQLGKGGYLHTVRGKFGGVRLAVPPEDVRLGQFVLFTEGDLALARCMDKDNSAKDDSALCLIKATCVARQAFEKGLIAFIDVLDQYTLADMLAAEDSPFLCPPS